MTEDRPPQAADPAGSGAGTTDDIPGTSTGAPPFDAPFASAGGPSAGPGAGPGPGASGPYEEPPPVTAFAWRNGLVRPTQGRLLAGVCGALGRATNTDPILWRVILAVLTLFGGIGALAYLIGWLLLPADGDTGSPLEALLGRGRSGTATVLTIIGGIIALLSLGAFVSEPFRPGILGAALLAGAILLFLRDQRSRNRAGVAPGAVPPVPPAAAPATAWPAPPWPAGPPGPTPQWPAGPAGPTPTGSASGAPMTGATMTDLPRAPEPPGAQGPYGPPSSTAYPPQPPYLARPYSPYATQAPFAPRGPFAAGPRPAPLPLPPRPPRPPRSRLGRLTFSLVLIVLGVTAAVDLTGASVPVPAYVAGPLIVVSAGLILGAWVGRARSLIALGIILTIALGSATTADRYGEDMAGGTVTWRPSTLSQVDSSYNQDVGNAHLDLTRVDFATAPTVIVVSVQVSLGNLRISLPPNVDVVVDASADAGNIRVLGQNWNGLGLEARTVTDDGADGPGGGQLHIHAAINLGNVEVER